MRLAGVSLPLVVALALSACASAGVPAGASDAEIDALTDRMLDERWVALGLPGERPVTPRIAFTSGETFSTTQVTCLDDAGLPAREVSGGFAIDGDGGFSPVDSAAIQFQCLAEYPRDPRPGGFLSAAQILYLYDYLNDRLAPCLQLNGYPVEPSPPRDGYIDAVRSGDYWNPYLNNGKPVGDFARIDVLCPPPPAQVYSAVRAER